MYKDTNEAERIDRRKRQFMRQFSSEFMELESTFDKLFYDYWKKCGELHSIETTDFLNTIKEYDMGRIRAKNYSKDRLLSVIHDSNVLDIDTEKCMKQEEIKQLQNQKHKLEEETKQEKINLTRLFAKGTIKEEDYIETLQHIENQKQNIENQMEEL